MTLGDTVHLSLNMIQCLHSTERYRPLQSSTLLTRRALLAQAVGPLEHRESHLTSQLDCPLARGQEETVNYTSHTWVTK